ncbi:MAG: ABC transporter substrate-binding protein [Bacteroidetes bacterium]|nr:ABC transporter substrate-binding protein [Bacteroidota bacterium]
MNTTKISLYLSLIIFLACACNNNTSNNTQAPTETKIISIGGAITETLFALDLGANIQAVDVTSTYPNGVNNIPKLGHLSNISLEGLLNFNPDHVVSINDPAGTGLFQQLKNSDLELELLESPTSIEGTKSIITSIGKVFHKEAEATQLLNNLDNDLKLLDDYLKDKEEKPKVLFLYARGSDMLMVGGKATTADHMIQLAGGTNAANSFNDFKPLSPEAAIEANPDVILVFDTGLNSLNGVEGVLALPGIAETNAAKNRKVVAMDGHYLLGFGPRVGQAALELAKSIR